MTINIAPVNDAPVAAGDSYATDKNVSLTATSSVLANDIDQEGDALVAQLVQAPQHGSLVLNSNGLFTYTPFTNYSGTDSFTYQAYDGQTVSNIATVTIAINNTNTAPVAAADQLYNG